MRELARLPDWTGNSSVTCTTESTPDASEGAATEKVVRKLRTLHQLRALLAQLKRRPTATK